MRETSLKLGKKIYKDRSKILFVLFKSTNIDKMLKVFSMEGYLPISYMIHLSY